jgi:hypothetical protein
MGDTLSSIATIFSLTDRNFSVWDKWQLWVIISQTKLAKDTIFARDKESTFSILQTCTQWTDHMENILIVLTSNIEENDQHDENKRSRSTTTQALLPF